MEEQYKHWSLGSSLLPEAQWKTVRYLSSDTVSAILKQFTSAKNINGKEVVIALDNSIKGESFILIGTDKIAKYKYAISNASIARVTTRSAEDIDQCRKRQFGVMKKYEEEQLRWKTVRAPAVVQKPYVPPRAVVEKLSFFERIQAEEPDAYKKFMEMKLR